MYLALRWCCWWPVTFVKKILFSVENKEKNILRRRRNDNETRKDIPKQTTIVWTGLSVWAFQRETEWRKRLNVAQRCEAYLGKWTRMSLWLVEQKSIYQLVHKAGFNVTNKFWCSETYSIYIEIKYSDWMLKDMRLVLTNWSSLFLQNLIRLR